MKQAVRPPGEAMNDYDILARIGARLGFERAFTEGRDEMAWLRELYDRSMSVAAEYGYNLPDFDSFWEAGEHAFEERMTPKALLQDFRADPVANPLPTPSGRIEIRSERVAGFRLDDCPGLATWFEPAEWLGNAPEGALHLISNQPARKLHSQLDLGSYSRAGKVAQREPARLNPKDARARGIRDGQVIRLRSARGACLAGAVISEDVAEGVVQMSTGAWLDLDADGVDRHGNVNVLTLDKPTSRLAQGPTAHTTIVFAEPFEGEAPPVRAYQPPDIEEQERI
jgi:biotin/methionine sulfoxide reductase